MPQLLLTEAEAARVLSLSVRTLRDARKAGTLRYVLIGRAVRYTPADLTDYIDSLRQVQPQCPPTAQPLRTSGQRRSGTIIPFHRRTDCERL